MTESVDLYFSFRSPYSYLATPGALAIREQFDIDIALRPVLPLALREPAFFDESNRERVKYILLDWQRRAKMLGLPHRFPSPDPIVQDMTTFQISSDQPFIYRLVYLGVEAENRGKGLEFAAEISRVIWGGTTDWHLGDHLALATERAGLVLADLEAAIADPTSHRHQVEVNQNRQLQAGHRGVPTFVYKGEPFFGQDRIDSLAWQLRQDNLEKR